MSLDRILSFAERENYKGYDPYDGLLSPLSRINLPIYRLLFQQFVKRVDEKFRKILLIPKGHNPKGLALFLWTYSLLGDEERAKKVWEILRGYAIKTNGGIAFGYNFPWQSSVFYVPLGTPNVIATSFVVFALNCARKVFGWKIDLGEFLPFYEKTLNVFRDENGYLWMSYTPLDRLRIFNSSVLGALAYLISGGKEETAREIAKTLINYQGEDGRWIYGLDRITMKYVDNIHTAYNLWGLLGIKNILGDDELDEGIRKGYSFYINNLFDKETHLPISKLGKKKFDTHDVAVSIITFKIFGDKNRAKRLEDWALRNLVDENGRVFNGKNDKRVFMRWSVGWLALSLAFKPHFPFT
jgi:hypothetical protein